MERCKAMTMGEDLAECKALDNARATALEQGRKEERTRILNILHTLAVEDGNTVGETVLMELAIARIESEDEC